MEELGVPGFSLWLLAAGEEDGFGLGVTSVDNPLPVDPDTIFQAGSITKTLTATAALRLAQQGSLDLDRPIAGYLQHVPLQDPEVAAAITMRDLLSHGGGFVGDWFDDHGFGDDALERFVATFGQLAQLTPLREVWSYNNAGFCLAGRVLEVVAGMPYEDVVRAHVWPEALFFPWEVMTRRHVVGHIPNGARVEVAEPWAVPRNAGPAGTWLASARSLVAYGRMHLEDDSLASMREPVLETQPGEHMGLGWFVKDRDGVGVAEHGGTTNGQCAWLTLAPAHGFAIAALANHAHGHALIRRVLERAFEEVLGIAPWSPADVELAPARLAEYAGMYETPLNGTELRLEDGRLILVLHPKGGFPKPDSPPRPAPPPAAVRFHGDDRFYVVDGVLEGQRGQFVRDEDGTIAWLRFGLRIHAPVQPDRSE